MSEVDERILEEMQAKRASIADVAQLLGIHRNTLERKCLKSGIVLEPVQTFRIKRLYQISAPTEETAVREAA
jgi:transposase-like protein